jgi:hypothetical protein
MVTNAAEESAASINRKGKRTRQYFLQNFFEPPKRLHDVTPRM